jgi:hypothetical protein
LRQQKLHAVVQEFISTRCEAVSTAKKERAAREQGGERCQINSPP